MGCYLSTPDDQVFITEGRGNNFRFATASCQGWRREQEDAEACIPYFDDDASLFVLCDGHGGAEVANYTVEHLPNFLKNHPLYKDGKYEEALEKAFIEFDASLKTPEATIEMCKIAQDFERDRRDKNLPLDLLYDPDNTFDPTVAEDVDVETLRREAKLPITELIDKYTVQLSGKTVEQKCLDVNDPKPSSSKDYMPSDNPEPSSSSSGSSGGPAEVRELVMKYKKEMAKYFDEVGDDESSEDSDFEGNDKSESEDDEEEEEDDDDDDDEEDEDEEEEDEDGDDERDEETTSEKNKSKRLRRKRHRKSSPDLNDSSTEDDSEDDDDESSDDSTGTAEEEEDEEEDDDDDDASEDDETDKLARTLIHRAGMRPCKPAVFSGCTVVVALMKKGKLYVASAGDSRCIVITRSGECEPMSFDHKPEDSIEFERISKAGGRVTEGRVNGGLNLSRAFGDFTYKDPNRDAKEQMITPCPDVRTTNLESKDVEYIFLACDGIWNSMQNQQVTSFIRKLAPSVKYNLVDICLGLFRNCIAPGTDGDGTGCDNMTCILVKFDGPEDCTEDKQENDEQVAGKSDLNSSTNEPTTSKAVDSSDPVAETKSTKRSAEDESDDKQTIKRRCMRLLKT